MKANMETMQKAKAGDNQAARVMYLDYVNNFLTIAGFSEYYGIAHSSGEVYIKWWRELHEEYCASIKAGDSE